MASLGFRDVSKRFGDGTLALSRVSLDVNDGEFVVLVGPSGCGKSTLLRSAAGLEHITAGEVLLAGRAVTHLDPGARDIAMVFQNYALYPHMTVGQNMAFALEQRRMSKAEISTRVAEAARTLGLTALLDRKPGALSGGQRQRVAMGRAIVRDPACFLMDEPLSNLDAALRVQMRSELKLLNTRLGATTVYVTHDQVEAMTMGERVAVLSPVTSDAETNLQQYGSPKELYERPANTFVAGFIGSPAMNFVPAQLAARDDGVSAIPVGTATELRFPPARVAPLRPMAGRDVLLGIRPEHFSLGGPSPGHLPVEVLVTEMTGPDGYIHFDVPSQPLEGVALVDDRRRMTARIEPKLLPRVGETVSLAVDIEHIHVFDPASGRALR